MTAILSLYCRIQAEPSLQVKASHRRKRNSPQLASAPVDESGCARIPPNFVCQNPAGGYNVRMTEPIIAQKIPYVLDMQPGSFYWCTCGRSKKQPFCDGSHKGTGFAPKKTDITVAKTVAWCGCKHSQNGAFCDGSHSKLP